MSRKRYNSGTRGGGSSKGQFHSTSRQRSSYEDSLAVECLIRAFLDLGGMEDPILKVLFIGGSKPKQGETDMDLAFKRLKSCWLEKKERSYGMREVLRMKMVEKGIKVDMNPKWARFSVMGALSLSPLRFGLIRKERRRTFQKIFRWKNLRMVRFYQTPQSELKRMDTLIQWPNSKQRWLYIDGISFRRRTL